MTVRPCLELWFIYHISRQGFIYHVFTYLNEDMLRVCLDQMLNDRQAKAAGVEKSFTVTHQSFKNQSPHKKRWMRHIEKGITFLVFLEKQLILLSPSRRYKAPAQLHSIHRICGAGWIFAMCSWYSKENKWTHKMYTFLIIFLLCLRWSSNWGEGAQG